MKKSLVALAALAATSAFAQVTLSGNIDFANASVSGSQLLARGTTISQTTGTSSTSVLNIRAVEDIGGGMKVTGHYGLDPRSLANDAYAVTNNNSTTADVTTAPGTAKAQANTATGLSRDELFVGIEGAFGNLRLGAPNSIGLNSFQVSSPLGTGVGSSYTGGGTAGTMTNSYVQTRYNRSLRWDSPVINGFQAAILYAPGNDQPAVTTTASGTASSVPVAMLIPNARNGTEFGLRYTNGPLTASYASVEQATQTNGAGWYATGTAGLVKTKVNLINASYNLGATTVYAGWNDGDALASTTTVTATKGQRLAIKQDMGTVVLIAQQSTQTSGTSNTKATVTGLRADYLLSKTAAAYIGYENWDTGAAYGNNLTTGTRKITSIGLRKSF